MMNGTIKGLHAVLLLTGSALVACGVAAPRDGGGSGGAAAATGGGSAEGGGVVAGGGAAATGGGSGAVAMYPSWQLTDIQPTSPRFNQSYGLDAFAGRPVVAVLLEGF
jgi:hypothetical protein